MKIHKKTLVAQQTVAAGVVAHRDFIAKSRASKEALKSANLLKSLNLNALIIGQRGVGKKTLARHTIDAPISDGLKTDELLKALELNDKLIIKNFDKISNFTKIKKAIDIHKNKIIATAESSINSRIEDDFFSIKIQLPPLSQRAEDVKEFIQIFYLQAKEIFGNESYNFDFDSIDLDLSKNIYSLKKSVYIAYMNCTLKQKDIEGMLEVFLFQKLGSGNDYRELLPLFDIPLIKSGFKKFGSQLAISKALGLNRNTLRKKINEYKLEG
ncbi:MAG: Fis family transcriptional regulator [Campylobacteraceae bacterium]|nr:Fis family transcriptional regulator [Campylobacteraceae bacterium]